MISYKRYRSYGHTPLTAFVLSSPWWLWFIVFPIIIAIVLLYIGGLK